MATIEYEVCDRCKEKIDYHSRKLATVHRAKINWIFCGIVNEYKYQLCKNCSEELDVFLSSKVS